LIPFFRSAESGRIEANVANVVFAPLFRVVEVLAGRIDDQPDFADRPASICCVLAIERK
jgi:hypothetical protein